jgi:hypothetical protein
MGMWFKNGCDFDDKFVNFVYWGQESSFVFLFIQKIALLLVGTYSRLHFGQRRFPLHLIFVYEKLYLWRDGTFF